VCNSNLGSPFGKMRLLNGTITGVSNPTIVSGNCSGDTDAVVTVTFTVDTSTCTNVTQVQNTDTCAVEIFFGAHISRQIDYGNGTTAVDISGSPYHVALASLDGTVGQKDNQMQAGTVVVAPTVTTQVHNAAHQDITNTSIALGSTVHDNVTVTG